MFWKHFSCALFCNIKFNQNWPSFLNWTIFPKYSAVLTASFMVFTMKYLFFIDWLFMRYNMKIVAPSSDNNYITLQNFGWVTVPLGGNSFILKNPSLPKDMGTGARPGVFLRSVVVFLPKLCLWNHLNV